MNVETVREAGDTRPDHLQAGQLGADRRLLAPQMLGEGENHTHDPFQDRHVIAQPFVQVLEGMGMRVHEPGDDRSAGGVDGLAGPVGPLEVPCGPHRDDRGTLDSDGPVLDQLARRVHGHDRAAAHDQRNVLHGTTRESAAAHAPILGWRPRAHPERGSDRQRLLPRSRRGRLCRRRVGDWPAPTPRRSWCS